MAAGSIVIDLLMKTGSFETDTKRAERRLKEFEKSAARVGKIIGTAIGAGAVAAVAGFTMIINKQRELIDAQAKLAQSMNTTYASLSNLERAGQLAGVGFEQISVASRQLDINLGRAAQGSKAQADALDRLGLSTEKLAAMPLDERIATINQALRDNIPAYERSAVAAELFGARNAAAMQRLDPATIEEAARQVEIFGLNLSDVDAAKVEMANDAFSTFGMLADGIQKQMTVAFAPALKALGDEFLRSAEEAGGLGTVVMDTADTSVRAIGFMVNAASGFVRVLELSLETGKLMAYGISGLMLSLANTIVNGPLAAVNLLIEQMNRIPGISVGPIKVSGIGGAIQRELAAAERGFNAARKKIDDLLLTPLAGDRMVRAWERALKDSQEAAEKAVSNRIGSPERAPSASGGDDKSAKRIQQQIQALQMQAAMLGMSATEAKLYELAVMGASRGQLSLAKSALDSIESFNEYNKKLEEGKKLTIELRSPEEAYQSRLSDIRDLLDAGAISFQVYLKAIREAQDEYYKISEAGKKANEQIERLKSLLAETPTAKLDVLREDMQLLADGFLAGVEGLETYDRYVEAVQTRLGTLPDDLKKVKSAMDKFADQAARNMQTAFADFLFDPFQDGVSGMVKGFSDALRRMAAELLASQVLSFLGNTLSGSSGILGAIGKAMVVGARADGGPVSGGKPYLIGERGPEVFVPNTSGTVMSNESLRAGGGSTNVRIVNAFDTGVIGDYMGSSAGEETILNVVSRNAAAIRSLVT